MFEKANPAATPPAQRIAPRDVSEVDRPSCEAHAIDAAGEAIALRQIEWGELTAKLSAARDLRELLRKDMNAKLLLGSGAGEGGSDTDFASAAARFFRANEEDQRAVNHKALEHRKTSSGMYRNVTDATITRVPHAEPFPMRRCNPGDVRDK